MLELVPTRDAMIEHVPLERSLCFTPYNKESEVEELGFFNKNKIKKEVYDAANSQYWFLFTNHRQQLIKIP